MGNCSVISCYMKTLWEDTHYTHRRNNRWYRRASIRTCAKTHAFHIFYFYNFLFLYLLYFFILSQFITRGNPVSKSLFHKTSKGLFYAKTLPIFVAGQAPAAPEPRGIKLAALQSSGVFDPRGSLARGNKSGVNCKQFLI